MNKFIEKYKNISMAAKASYWFIICNIFQKGLAFVTIPIYTRLLTTTEYGTYSVYNTWFNIITIFASLSLSAGFFNVGILKYENEKSKFLSAVQGLSSVSTILVFIFCFIFNNIFYKITELNMGLLLIMSVQMLFSTPLLYWSAKQRFEFKYRKVVIVTILSSIVTVGISILLIYIMEDRSYSLIIGAAIVQVIVGIFFYIYNLFQGKCFYDKQIWKYAISFGIPLVPHYLSYTILNSSDRVMINNMCSTSEAGIYSLACQISIAINLVTSAIDASMNPWVYQKLKVKEYKDISKITTYIVIVFGVVVIGCVLVAPEILLLVAPEEYQAAKWVMPTVIVGCFFLYLAGCFMRVAFYHEKKSIITLASVFASVLNIVLNVIFIPKYGFIAAAYTTLISYMFFSIIHYTAMKSICRDNKYKSLPFDGKLIIIFSTIIVVVALALLVVYPYPLIRYGIVLFSIIGVWVNRREIIRKYKEIKGAEV